MRDETSFAPSGSSRHAVSVTLTEAGHALIESTVRDLLTHEEELVAELTTATDKL